jgi:hypothetical protein
MADCQEEPFLWHKNCDSYERVWIRLSGISLKASTELWIFGQNYKKEKDYDRNSA